LVKQRRRWLSAQLHYSKYLPDAIYNLLKKGNIDFFDKSIQMVLPPRIILLGIIPLFTIISLFVNPLPITLIWVVVFLLLILSMLFAIPWKFYSFTTLSALTSLPKGFFLMIFSLLSTRGANKKFIHTQHTASNIQTKT